MNKCIKIILKKCNELDNKTLNKLLWALQKKTSEACNMAMRMYRDWEYDKIDYKNHYNEYPNEKEMFGKQYYNVICGKMKETLDMAYARNVDTTNQTIKSKWNTNRNDVLRNKVSVPSFKSDMPIYICGDGYTLSENNKKLSVDVALFNQKYGKDNGYTHLTFEVDKLNKCELATIHKIINSYEYINKDKQLKDKIRKEKNPINQKQLKEEKSKNDNVMELTYKNRELYKQGMAQIKQNKKGKWEFIISFNFEKKIKNLDKNRILGIDLGMVNTVTMQIWDDNVQDWERLSWKNCIIDGKEILHFNQKIHNRRNYLRRSCKLVSETKIGHGKQVRMKRVEILSNKEANFKDCFNKKTAKYIVDFAIKNNCGIIQMEDLTGYKTDDKFLKNWTYYDLQTKIKNKAEEYGIEVRYIIPNYTSLRCSNCGFIDSQNRDCKNNQSKFQCISCDYGKINEKGKGKVNADINASRNISLPNIEDIILEQLKTQSEVNDTYLKMYNTYKKALSDRDRRNKEHNKKIA